MGKAIRLLGIDPGLRLTGFACVAFASQHPGAAAVVSETA